jgi:hypothetical protein
MKITGIKRNSSLLHDQDGACTEIINMRFKDDEWQSIQPGTQIADFSALPTQAINDLYFHHRVLPDNLIIWWRGYNGDLDIIDSSTGSVSTTIKNIPGVKKLYEFGRILLAITDDDVFYFKYDNAAYTELEQITHGRYWFDDTDSELAIEEFTPGTAGEYGSYVSDGISKALERKRALEQQGKTSGHVFFRIAFRTVDGNYILHSPIYYRFIGYKNDTEGIPYIEFESVSSVLKYYYNLGRWAKPNFHFYLDQNQIDIINSYDGQIDSVCLFMSKPYYERDFSAEESGLEKRTKVSGEDTYDYNFYPLTKSIEDYFDNNNSFYLVKKIPLSELENINVTGEEFTSAFDVAVGLENAAIYDNTVAVTSADGNTTYIEGTDYTIDYLNGTITVLSTGTMADATSYKINYRHYLNYTIEAGDIETLVTKEDLPVDNFTSHRYFSNVAYEYNSRLHYGAVKTRLGDVPNLSVYDMNPQGHLPEYTSISQDASDLTEQLYALVTLNTDQGLRYVLTKWDNIAEAYNSVLTLHASCTNQIIMYPDQRAVSLRFLWYDGATYKNTAYKEVKLKSSRFGNYSYSIPSEIDVSVDYGTGTPLTIRILQYIMVYESTKGDYTLPTINNVLQDNNRVQVSELNNILEFPAKNSYRIGKLSSRIMGICSQAVPVSTGQYGQYPLNVFSEDGIFTLEPGGSVLYQSIVPVSLHACNNTESVIPVEGGILFSTQYGLFVLSGSQVTEISIPVEGTPQNFLDALQSYQDVTVGLFPDAGDAISTNEFKTFIAGAQFGYDVVTREIIVTNRLAGYSYIYNTLYNLWYKSTSMHFGFIHIAGRLFTMEPGILRDYSTPDNSQEVTAMIITRPVKLGSNGLKKINRAIARLIANIGTIKVVNSLSFNIYGSLDGYEWKFIQGKYYNDFERKQIALELPNATARYFIFLLALNSKVIRFEEFEIDAKPVANNKLR